MQITYIALLIIFPKFNLLLIIKFKNKISLKTSIFKREILGIYFSLANFIFELDNKIIF